MAGRAVTVIIPNYNGMKFLPQCIESLKNQSTSDFDILVIDNGSSDGSIDWLRKNAIHHMELESNLGFAGGVNVGIKRVHTPYVLLLNNDTIADSQFVEQMLYAIKNYSDAFAISALMIKESNHNLVDSAGDGMTIMGWAYQRGVDEPVDRYQKPCEVFSACAGAAIYDKSILDKIGYFDEMHFAYLEDVDLSWRARIAGYKIYYWPGARVYHLGSATSGSKYNSFKVRLSSRNSIYLQFKNEPLLQLYVNLQPIAGGIIFKLLFFWPKGFTKDYFDGMIEGFKTLGKCKRTPWAKGGIWTYVVLEWRMFVGMLEYTFSFLRRHL